jgi:alcohol dehydrogenase class IV
MKTIRFHQPGELVFGDHCFEEFAERSLLYPYNRFFIIADMHVVPLISTWLDQLKASGKHFQLFTEVISEPSADFFCSIRKEVEEDAYDAVVGIGGGSVLDTAKLVAALSYSGQDIRDVFGIGKLSGRKLFLACIPTTAGTGSEVSPNAVLLDQDENLKKGVVSPFLVPDVAYIDPVLTYTVPAGVTAATGIDALTHCLEAYANRFAHPLTDLYALEGIRLIARSLETACRRGDHPGARADVALGSLYGGLCLGPVNTAAVHALSYPLGGEYHIAHGISNAMLLPFVMEKNLPEAAERYAGIGRAIGAAGAGDTLQQAHACIAFIRRLCARIGIPGNLSGYNIGPEDVPGLTKAAMNVQRLLKNNLRELTEKEVSEIYTELIQQD